MNARDFVAPQEAVTGIAGNSLLVEHIEDLFDQDEIGRGVIGVPEFLQKSSAIPLRAAENEISKIGIEDFVDERAVIRRLDGAGAHDEVDVRGAWAIVQIHENFRSALARAYYRYSFGVLVSFDLAKVAVRMENSDVTLQWTEALRYTWYPADANNKISPQSFPDHPICIPRANSQ